MSIDRVSFNRRRFVACLGSLGLGSTLLPGPLAAVAQDAELALTNLTGRPEVSVPSGFHEGSPTSLRFTGKLFGESEILLLAHAFQRDDGVPPPAPQPVEESGVAMLISTNINSSQHESSPTLFGVWAPPERGRRSRT